jgi:hypothetical protein
METYRLETPQSLCADRTELLKNYSNATIMYSDLVKQFTAKTGTLSQEHCLHLKALTEEARVVSELARTALERHVVEHSCQESKWPIPST